MSFIQDAGNYYMLCFFSFNKTSTMPVPHVSSVGETTLKAYQLLHTERSFT